MWGSFLKTAALIDRPDLVISVDTAVMRLAGALGSSWGALESLCNRMALGVQYEDPPGHPDVQRQPVPHFGSKPPFSSAEIRP
jgi:hypothetical protein